MTAFVLVSCLLFTSCQKRVPTYPGPSALESGNWKRVSDDPPTYFPKGLAAGSSTQPWDGSWVNSGDEKGTRFFVPARAVGGVSAKTLSAEAHAAMTSEEKAKREELVLHKDVEKALLIPVVIAVIAGVIVLMALPDDDDTWSFN